MEFPHSLEAPMPVPYPRFRLETVQKLCLVLAVTTLYLTLQGTAIVEASHRRWVDVHTYRGMSHLKIGWEWVTSYARKGWTLFTPSLLKTNRDPDSNDL
jgi:hypothetical protein